MKRKLLIIFIGALIFISLSGVVHAEMKYTLLESFPGFFTGGKEMTDLPAMILAIYKFGIWTVGIAGLFMLTIGGFWYMTSAGNNATAETAKKIIADSLLGIVAALAAYLVMYVINPDLTKINIAFTPTTVAPGAVAVVPGAAPPPAAVTACSDIPSQVPGQCSNASTELVNLLSCINGKLSGKIQISSISDGNGGVNCYVDHPTWRQCSASGGSNCCYHTKNSCHYGGTSCGGKSYAADFSKKGSKASVNEILSAASECGATYVLNEGNHAHVSVGASCGCH